MTEDMDNMSDETPEPEGMGPGGSEITSDDKLWAALGYPIPLIPILVLLMEDKKGRPFLRFHAIQSLVLNVAVWAIITILSVVTLGIGAICAWILWFVVLWPAFDAFQGNYTNIPVLTDFIRNQGLVK
ncbi:MAG TPA: hypothetical protein VF177_01030 [Anaerolineae bacterium]